MRGRLLLVVSALISLTLLACQGSGKNGNGAPQAAVGPVTSLMCVHALETAGSRGGAAQLRGLNEAGETVWSADVWPNYPKLGPGRYRTAIVDDRALVHIPLGPDEHYFVADLANGGEQREATAEDPLVQKATSESLFTPELVMPYEPKLVSVPGQSVEFESDGAKKDDGG